MNSPFVVLQCGLLFLCSKGARIAVRSAARLNHNPFLSIGLVCTSTALLLSGDMSPSKLSMDIFIIVFFALLLRGQLELWRLYIKLKLYLALYKEIEQCLMLNKNQTKNISPKFQFSRAFHQLTFETNDIQMALRRLQVALGWDNSLSQIYTSCILKVNCFVLYY